LTTAKYYTPKGRSIQAEGIKPDINLPFNPVEEKEEEAIFRTLRERDLSRHLEGRQENETSQDEDEGEVTQIEQRLQKDNQLQLALQLVKSLPLIKALQ
jgi:carboxyl-terminal processing protease